MMYNARLFRWTICLVFTEALGATDILGQWRRQTLAGFGMMNWSRLFQVPRFIEAQSQPMLGITGQRSKNT